MENKVFYGEYSLEHWIELILKGNIQLPWYQRSFVWEKKQIQQLIITVEDNQFIPPVIIGAVRKNKEWLNFILDGQQRLTSILFAKINKYIDKKEYVLQNPDKNIEQMAEDIVDNEEINLDEEVKMIKWDFKTILDNKNFNWQELEKPVYKQLLDNVKDESFFKQHFLGFAYIKPSESVNDDDQSKFYSDIFRNINTGVTKLTRLESRKSFYFLKENLKEFFAPEFLGNIKVETSSKESGLIDFIKYLAILSQYLGNKSQLLKYGGRDWVKNENYYEEYITAVVNNNSTNPLCFAISFPSYLDNNARLDSLKNSLSELEIPKSFNSVIDMDLYFFGLVNEVVFLNNLLDEAKKVVLKTEILEKIEELREQENHKFNPNALKYLKSRINASLEIYSKYKKDVPNE